MTGLPDEGVPYQPQDTTVADAAGALVWLSNAEPATADQRVYVDTAAVSAWVLPVGAAPAALSLGVRTIGWRESGARGPELVSVARPRAGDAQAGPVVRRAWPSQAVEDHFGSAEVEVVPYGEEVLLARAGGWGEHRRTQDHSVLAVGPDGSTGTVLDWGHDPRLSPTGAVYVLTGRSPETRAVARLDASGAAQPVVALRPVPLPVHAVALDGRRVAASPARTAATLVDRTVTTDETVPRSSERAGSSPPVSRWTTAARLPAACRWSLPRARRSSPRPASPGRGGSTPGPACTRRGRCRPGAGCPPPTGRRCSR